jgi:hypothetical protein
MHDRAIGMAVGHAGRPDPATDRRSVPSAWRGRRVWGADSSCPTQLSTSIFHFPVETGDSGTRSGYRDGRRTCRPVGPRDCPSVSAVGMAGQLGWECRLEWADTTVHIHLSVPSRGWRVRFTIGLSGWPSDMPAGRTQHCPSVCAVGMAGQLGWECRLEWPNTTVHIHLSLPSRDWRLGYPLGLSGWPSDMPAGRTKRLTPDLSGIGDSPPSPSRICRGRAGKSGTGTGSPVPDSHRGFRALPRSPANRGFRAPASNGPMDCVGMTVAQGVPSVNVSGGGCDHLTSLPPEPE